MERPPAQSPSPEPAAVRPRRRWLLWSVLGAVAVAAGAVALFWGPEGAEPVATPEAGQAPEFRLPDVRDPDNEVALADFQGGPVVLNFWASWCVPCRKEMPALEEVHDEVGEAVAFVGINNSDARGPALDLLEETGVSYPSGFDPDGDVFLAYDALGMPTTVFISPEGRMLGRHTGEISREDLLDALERFFGVEVRQGDWR